MGGDEAVGGAADDDVDTVRQQRGVQEAQVHLRGRDGEAEAIGGHQPGQAVGTLDELPEEPDSQGGRVRSEVGQAPDAEAA